MQAFFQLPKARCHASEVDDDYSALPAPHSLDRDYFLPLWDMPFGSHDFWLTQPQKTLAYTKALQHWVEKAQPLTPGEPHQLTKSVLELQCAMESLTTFTNEEVLEDVLPSNWVKITSSRAAKPTPRECSYSRTQRARATGSFSGVHGEKWSQATATTQMSSEQATPTHKAMPEQTDSSNQCLVPPPGFVEIPQSLHGDNLPRVVSGTVPELADVQGPIQMVGSSMLSTWLFMDATSGVIHIDMVMCSMDLVGVGYIPQQKTTTFPPS